MGSLCLVRVGTIMTNRSSHIPIRMEIEAMTVPEIVRVFLKLRMGRGMTKQKRNGPEVGAKLPCQLGPEDGHVNRLIAIKDGDDTLRR